LSDLRRGSEWRPGAQVALGLIFVVVGIVATGFVGACAIDVFHLRGSDACSGPIVKLLYAGVCLSVGGVIMIYPASPCAAAGCHRGRLSIPCVFWRSSSQACLDWL
jgi:hypothetical protein